MSALVRPETLQRVSAHVHVIPDQSRPRVPNVGIVVGDRRVLVIDTGMGPPNGALVRDTALRLAPGRPLTIATTHVHPEHDLGAQAFPLDALMVRSRAQVDEIGLTGMTVAEDFRAASAHYRELLEGAAFRDADIVFDREITLDLGGVEVTITAMGTNHTDGDTIAFVRQDGVLFSGDIAMTGAPAFASPRSRVTPWIRSLEYLRGVAAEIIVPSHGPIAGARMVEDYVVHLTRISQRVGTLRQAGVDTEAVVATVTDERIADYRDADRLRGAIMAAVREHEEETLA